MRATGPAGSPSTTLGGVQSLLAAAWLASLVAASLAAVACGPADGGSGNVPPWPDRLPPAEAFGARRELTPVRAAIHLHSVYSHDACDRQPADSLGRPDERCLARLRRAICLQRIDAVFLTEHDRRLSEADSLKDALLFRDGDEPIESGGRLVAKRQPCGEGRSAVWLAGAENALMPVAFDSLPRGTVEERRSFYDADTAGAADLFRALGAVVLLSHSEDMDAERVLALAPDGIEVVNPHAMFAPRHRQAQGLSRLGAYVGLLPFLTRQTAAHPDLALLAVYHENRRALDHWDRALARGPMIGFGASDAHENAVPWTFSDGKRGDAYERLVSWVTNVLLVERGDAPAGGAAGDVAAIEDALRRGRMYVAVEAWGTPAGFDFRLEGPPAPEGAEGAAVVEMGETILFAPGQELVLDLPHVELGGMDPAIEPGLLEPLVHARIWRIGTGGRRELLAETAVEPDPDRREPLDVPVPGPGVYRAEVSIVPRHLEPYLGGAAILKEVPWVYGNAIRVLAPGSP